jgi:hypothetical protein
MKALKLKGWVDGILGNRPKAKIATAHWFAVKPVPDMVKATLIVGEKAFTESEVKAMLADIGHHTIVFLNTNEYHSHIINTAKRHGVVFDPA